MALHSEETADEVGEVAAVHPTQEEETALGTWRASKTNLAFASAIAPKHKASVLKAQAKPTKTKRDKTLSLTGNASDRDC